MTYLLLGLSEESGLGLVTSLLGLLGLLEGGVGDLVELDTRNIELSRSLDHVSTVHSSQRNTVDLERTSDEEKTRGQSLQENNALASVRSGEDDQNSAWFDGHNF